MRCGAMHAVVSLKPSTLPAFFSLQRQRRPADGFIYLMIVFLVFFQVKRGGGATDGGFRP